MNIIKTFSALIAIASMSAVSAQNEGMATHFTGLGSPYGGCGISQSDLETQYFVALNTYDSPGEAIPPHADWLANKPAPADKMGEFANGKNCGRWIKVNLGPDCFGLNDGALGEPFCRGANAKWEDDQYSGAELYMIVADACPDENAWCRDSRYHLDMHKNAVTQFEVNGTPVGDDIFYHFNNRSISWEYVQAPNYTGDIKIFWMKGTQVWWPAISINHLENGIHDVEQLVNGQWTKLKMNGTMGQSYLLENDGTVGPFTIRVYDINDQLINNGREYSITIPASCNPICSDDAMETPATTYDPNPLPNPDHTQDMQLQEGWNLVALQVETSTTDIAALFPLAEQIKNADLFYQKGLPTYLNSLKSITPGQPYLVKNTSAQTLQFTGKYVKDHSSTLRAGWNLFTGPVDRPWTISSLGTDGKFLIKDLNSFGNETGLGQLKTTAPGSAYFYFINNDAVKVW